MKDISSLIRDIPNFPSEGIVFRDITPLLQNPESFKEAVKRISLIDPSADVIAGIEARGFIFATGAAILSGRGFIPIRKKGKLPFNTIEESYGLEYGQDVIQIHTDALKPGQKVLLVDDVLATGGTLIAAIKLIERTGAKVSAVAILLEIESLEGRNRLLNEFPNLKIETLVKG